MQHVGPEVSHKRIKKEGDTEEERETIGSGGDVV